MLGNRVGVRSQYDIFGNRIEKDVTTTGTAVTRYAYDMWNPAKAGAMGTSGSDIWAVLNGSSSLTSRELQGDGIDEHLAYTTSGSNAFWFLSDHLGSIRTVVDSTGAAVHAYSYDAFGNVTSAATPSIYAWTGRELDAETGLQYNRTRYYDAATGRWISLDPMGFDAGDSNLYRYVNNRPLAARDPSGLDYLRVSGGNAYWRQGEPGTFEYSNRTGISRGWAAKSSGDQIKLGTVNGNTVTYDATVGGATSTVRWLEWKIDQATFVSRGIVQPWNGPPKVTGGFWKLKLAHQQEIINDYLNDRLRGVTRQRFLGGSSNVDGYQFITEFFEWYEQQSASMAWVNPLREAAFLPPKTVKDAQGEWELPTGWAWDADSSLAFYHAGAAKGIRKEASNGSGAQATYDSNGDLITGGTAAGSADRSTPGEGFFNGLGNAVWWTFESPNSHYTQDVWPFEIAQSLDRKLGGTRFRLLYIEVRPVIVPPGAKANNVNDPAK